MNKSTCIECHAACAKSHMQNVIYQNIRPESTEKIQRRIKQNHIKQILRYVFSFIKQTMNRFSSYETGKGNFDWDKKYLLSFYLVERLHLSWRIVCSSYRNTFLLCSTAFFLFSFLAQIPIFHILATLFIKDGDVIFKFQNRKKYFNITKIIGNRYWSWVSLNSMNWTGWCVTIVGE